MGTRILFVGLLLAACALAWRWGGTPERTVAALFVAAYLASLLVIPPLRSRYEHVEWGVFCIDIFLLAGLLYVALTADRYWPMAEVAVQFVGSGAHLAKLLDADLIPGIYQRSLIVWSYLTLCILVWGTVRHHRRSTGRANWPSWLESSPRQRRILTR